jgi:FixJ family two-component response regulator
MKDRFESNSTVFVVDDEAEVREGLRALLSSVGLRSETFGSIAEFLRSKPPNEVSCLILDVRLPGIGGLDFQAELAAAEIGIPIIVITGYGDIPMTVRALKAGASDFLSKPFRDQDILDAVRIALDQDRARRESDGKTGNLHLRFETLSPREREVIALVTTGLMNKQVAAEVGLSENSVKVHRHNAMKKLGAESLADLVRMADALGISRGRSM